MIAIGTASIRLHDEEIASLELFESGDWSLHFHPAYRARPRVQRVPLGLFFEDRGLGPIKVESGPINWFINLLPQGTYGAKVARAAGVNERDWWNLLLLLGHDLSGAVVVEPSDTISPRTPQAKPVLPALPSGLHVSVAGMQPKMSLRTDGQLVVPMHGQEGDVIAKLHSPTYSRIVHNEFCTTRWAKLCGLQVPAVYLADAADVPQVAAAYADIGDGKMFVTKRFDRTPQGRIHMEDFAQIIEPPSNEFYDGRYEVVGAVVFEHCGLDDFLRFIDQLVFCVMCGNGDAHLKNWALLHRLGSSSLSPAYDLVSTCIYGHTQLAMPFWDKRDFADIVVDDFVRVGRMLGGPPTRISERVAQVVQLAHDKLSEAGFAPDMEQRIRAHMSTLQVR
jgi:serine/threonine-protein kinase HipA